jgi:hypothetical protein
MLPADGLVWWFDFWKFRGRMYVRRRGWQLEPLLPN